MISGCQQRPRRLPGCLRVDYSVISIFLLEFLCRERYECLNILTSNRQYPHLGNTQRGMPRRCSSSGAISPPVIRFSGTMSSAPMLPVTPPKFSPTTQTQSDRPLRARTLTACPSSVTLRTVWKLRPAWAVKSVSSAVFFAVPLENLCYSAVERSAKAASRPSARPKGFSEGIQRCRRPIFGMVPVIGRPLSPTGVTAPRPTPRKAPKSRPAPTT